MSDFCRITLAPLRDLQTKKWPQIEKVDWYRVPARQKFRVPIKFQFMPTPDCNVFLISFSLLYA